MQLVLGVAVADSTARLALLDADDPSTVFDQSEFPLAGQPTAQLASAIIDTDRSLAQRGMRLGSTRICWSDPRLAGELRDTLTRAGVGNVALVSATDAATSFVRNAATTAGHHTSALLLVDGDTAGLSVVGPDALNTSLIDVEDVTQAGPTQACNRLLDRLRDEPGGAQNLYVLTSSGDATVLSRQLQGTAPVPVQAAGDQAYLLARGAAMHTGAGAAAPTTQPGPVQGQHLAYSLVDDSSALSAGYSSYPSGYQSVPGYTGTSSYGSTPGYGNAPGFSSTAMTQAAPAAEVDPVGYPAATAAATPVARPRILLVGSTIAAIVVVGFAVLAVGVAIGIKPTVSEQAVRGDESVPGKYLPVLPGQGTAPAPEPDQFVPQVVPVPDAPPPPGGPSVFLASGPQQLTTSAGQVAQQPVAVPGLGAPVPGAGVPDPGPPDVAAPQLPAFNGFRLSDWLPPGLTINLGQIAAQTQSCHPGDAICVGRATGCWYTDSHCLTQRYGCKAGSAGCQTTVQTDQPRENRRCHGGQSDCRPKTLPDQTVPEHCPAGATCAPQRPDEQLSQDPDKQRGHHPDEPGGPEKGHRQHPGPDGNTVSEPPSADEPTPGPSTAAGPTSDQPEPKTSQSPESSSTQPPSSSSATTTHEQPTSTERSSIPEHSSSSVPPSSPSTPSSTPTPTKDTPTSEPTRESKTPTPTPTPEVVAPPPVTHTTAPAPVVTHTPDPEPEPASQPPQTQVTHAQTQAPAPVTQTPEPAPAPAPEPAPAPKKHGGLFGGGGGGLFGGGGSSGKHSNSSPATSTMPKSH